MLAITYLIGTIMMTDDRNIFAIPRKDNPENVVPATKAEIENFESKAQIKLSKRHKEFLLHHGTVMLRSGYRLVKDKREVHVFRLFGLRQMGRMIENAPTIKVHMIDLGYDNVDRYLRLILSGDQAGKICLIDDDWEPLNSRNLAKSLLFESFDELLDSIQVPPSYRKYGEPLTSIAAGDAKKVKEWIVKNKDPNRLIDCELNNSGIKSYNLLFLAAEFEQAEVFDLLLEHGADPNLPACIDGKKRKGLIYSCFLDHDILERALKAGADPDGKILPSDESILFVHPGMLDLDFLKLVHKYGADFKQRNKKGEPISKYFGAGGEKGQFLLKHGAPRK